MSEAGRAADDHGAIFDAHVKAEFVDKDVAAAMATMAPEPYLTHVPTLTGGTGRAEVERFYADYLSATGRTTCRCSRCRARWARIAWSMS